MSRRVILFAVVGALAVGGCATIPQPLQGNYAPVAFGAAQAGAGANTPVRWGGEIIETEPQEQQTCFFVLAEPLDSQARPKAGADSLGRFVACKQGFYDPEVFQKGREITVTGTLNGTVQHKIGQFDYTYPKVEANNVYLWPKRPYFSQLSYGPWAGPWNMWGPCDPYWSAWGCSNGFGPWAYPRRVIVVPRVIHTPPPPPPKKH